VRGQRVVPAGRSVPAGATCGVVELVDDPERGPLDPLDDELGDPVATRDLDGRGGVVVDQDHEDFAAVSRRRPYRGALRTVIPGGRPARSGGAPDRHSPRDRDGDAGPHRRAGARGKLDPLGGDQVGAGVARVGVGRQRQVGVERRRG